MLCIDQYSSIFCLSWVILYEHNTFSIHVKCSVTIFKYCVLFKERYMKIWLSSLKENINVNFPRSCTIRVVAYCLLILKGLGLCLVLLLQFKDILPLWSLCWMTPMKKVPTDWLYGLMLVKPVCRRGLACLWSFSFILVFPLGISTSCSTVMCEHSFKNLIATTCFMSNIPGHVDLARFWCTVKAFRLTLFFNGNLHFEPSSI